MSDVHLLSLSKLLFDNWFLLGASICLPTLTRRSTVAEDGSVVLNSVNTAFTIGYLFSMFNLFYAILNFV